jgi:hypothetical protein
MDGDWLTVLEVRRYLEVEFTVGAVSYYKIVEDTFFTIL